MKQRKVLGVFAVAGPGLLALSLALVTYFMIRTGQTVRSKVVATHESMMAASAVMARLVDAEAGERGYLLTGDQAFLAGYRDARSDIGREITRLRRASAGDAEQQLRISQAEALVARRLESMDRQVRLRRTAGMQTVRTDVPSGVENALSDSTRTIVSHVISVESRKRSSLIAAEERQARITIATVIVGSALALLLSLIINAILVRSATAAVASARALRSSNARLDQQAEELVVQTENLEEQTVQLLKQEEELQTRSADLEAQAVQLHIGEERYQALVNGVSDGVVLQNAEGQILACNAAAQRILRMSEEDIKGITVATRPWRLEREDGMLMDRADTPGMIALRTGKPAGPTLLAIVHRNEEKVWVQVTAQPIRLENGTIASVSTLSDVTELRQADEQLHRQQEMMAGILDGLSEAVIACDAEGVLTYLNPAAQRLSPEPAHPTPAARWEERYTMLHRETKTPLKLAETPLYRALQGEVIRDAELILAPPDSSPRYMIAHASPLRSAKGKMTGAVVILHDVTEILNAEAALQASDEKLRQAQKMEAIGALAGGIAHDFNNLLTAITSFGEFALGGSSAESEIRSDIEEILKASDRAASLTQQLLAFSRRQMLQPRNLDLSEVVCSTEKLLQRVLGADIEIELKNQPGLGVVWVDPVQIEQVILNLAINSRHAMPAGGRLVIETGNLHLDEAAAQQIPGTRPGDYVVLTVSDTGSGMDASTRQRVFEPFFTTKEQGKGTGLGLSSVYGIVKQSSGAITVYSEPGLGTTFRIYLPQAEGEASPLKSMPASEKTQGSETILVAEDQEAVRTAIRRILIARGYVVLEATNGAEALAIAEKHEGPIDLVITDMVMPKVGGIELCQVLATQRPDISMLVMSGYSETVTSEVVPKRARFVEKPFKIDAFAAVVRSVLDERLAA